MVVSSRLAASDILAVVNQTCDVEGESLLSKVACLSNRCASRNDTWQIRKGHSVVAGVLLWTSPTYVRIAFPCRPVIGR